MEQQTYNLLKNNWKYLHPLSKFLTKIDYHYEKIVSNKNSLRWTSRSIAIAYILFLAVFALDVFIPNQSIQYYLIALFMHLIPNLILTIFLIISWKNERIGALLFIFAFLALSTLFWDRSYVWMQLLLFSPLLIIGILFLNSAKGSPHLGTRPSH